MDAHCVGANTMQMMDAKTVPSSQNVRTRALEREAGMHETVVTVSHLEKVYGATTAVKDVSFSVQDGEIFGILGPNGAGKTTTVECISGLRAPDSGSIRVLGFDPRAERNEVRERVGVQLQEGAMPRNIKVGEAVTLFAAFYHNPLDPDEVLDALGLLDKRNAFFKTLSGGQKQRLSIALALVGNPRIAILDELTTGLDPQARRETWKFIEHLRDRGVTVLLVTHFMDEAERLCDRVAVIDHGKVVALDAPAALAMRYGGGTHMRFRPSKPFADEVLTRLPEVRLLEHEGEHVAITGTGSLVDVVLRALSSVGVEAGDVQVRSGSLEDAFVELVEDVEGSSEVVPRQ